MASMIESSPDTFTLADLARRFGPMPLKRIRFDPFPGTATEDDVLELYRRTGRFCELVDGVLVEKALGFRESILAGWIIYQLHSYLNENRLGTVSGEQGTVRLAPGLVRIPDVAFFRWERFPNRRVPNTPIPDVAPDLAVEVLSVSNTDEEMARKLEDYFASGILLVWFIDPRARTATVYTSPSQAATLHEDQSLDGGTLLPGFTLSLRQLFGKLDPHEPAPGRTTRDLDEREIPPGG